MSLEVVWFLQRFSNDSVVVNLAIDSKGNALILVGKRLRSTVDTNNTQTFMGKNFEVLVIASRVLSNADFLTGAVGHITSRPIWTTMATLLHHFQSPRLKSLCVWHMAIGKRRVSTGLFEMKVG